MSIAQTQTERWGEKEKRKKISKMTFLSLFLMKKHWVGLLLLTKWTTYRQSVSFQTTSWQHINRSNHGG